MELVISLLIALAASCGVAHPTVSADDIIRIHIEGQAAADAMNIVQWETR